jgi:hypothetical protein
MNNQAALQSLNDCSEELQKLQEIIEDLGQADTSVPFLTNYAIIKCCGTLETTFKTIITDFHSSIPPQSKSYIENTFLNSSLNPSKDNICKSLKKFDEQWLLEFKNMLNAKLNKSRLETSLSSLNEARNTFAHGGNPNLSFASVVSYYKDSREIIEILDEVVK